MDQRAEFRRILLGELEAMQVGVRTRFPDHLAERTDNQAERGLELVGHVVDEVVLDLAQFLLPEGHGDGVQEHAQQQEGEGQ